MVQYDLHFANKMVLTPEGEKEAMQITAVAFASVFWFA